MTRVIEAVQSEAVQSEAVRSEAVRSEALRLGKFDQKLFPFLQRFETFAIPQVKEVIEPGWLWA